MRCVNWEIVGSRLVLVFGLVVKDIFSGAIQYCNSLSFSLVHSHYIITSRNMSKHGGMWRLRSGLIRECQVNFELSMRITIKTFSKYSNGGAPLS